LILFRFTVFETVIRKRPQAFKSVFRLTLFETKEGLTVYTWTQNGANLIHVCELARYAEVFVAARAPSAHRACSHVVIPGASSCVRVRPRCIIKMYDHTCLSAISARCGEFGKDLRPRIATCIIARTTSCFIRFPSAALYATYFRRLSDGLSI
jgi:hypothetical protein